MAQSYQRIGNESIASCPPIGLNSPRAVSTSSDSMPRRKICRLCPSLSQGSMGLGASHARSLPFSSSIPTRYKNKDTRRSNTALSRTRSRVHSGHEDARSVVRRASHHCTSRERAPRGPARLHLQNALARPRTYFLLHEAAGDLCSTPNARYVPPSLDPTGGTESAQSSPSRSISNRVDVWSLTVPRNVDKCGYASSRTEDFQCLNGSLLRVQHELPL